MKSLRDYIVEAEGAADSKSFTFDFNGIEGSEEIVKSIQEIVNKDGANVSIDGNKVIVSVSAGSIDHLEGVQEILTEYINSHSKDQKRASDESYAQKLQKLEKTYASMMEFWDDLESADDEENKEASDNAPAAKATEDDKEDDK